VNKDSRAGQETGRQATRILIVEDELSLAQILADYLRRDGFEATLIDDGVAAMRTLQSDVPDLVLLDLMLPGMDGLAILRELRKTSAVPVIMTTARVEEIDRLIGLELGADDYVCKPYSPREVVARVKTVLRRGATRQAPPPASEESPARRHEAIVLDAGTWQAHAGGQRLELTPKEFQLLQAMLLSPGRVFSRGQLMQAIYDDKLEVSERAVDAHMKNLRRKLAQALPERELIRSIYGVGFVLEP
jgi:two-component system response regulator BaeR